MMLRVLLGGCWVLLLLVGRPAVAQSDALYLDLNIPALRLVVYEGDTPIRSYPVAVGMPGFDTPHGEFSISRAEWNPWWQPPQREWARDDKLTPPGPSNPMGRVKLFFAPLYFIHGTPEKKSIGTPASHGCVRMLNEDVIELARLLHERAGAPVSSREIDRILARSGQTRRVGFPNSIPLKIRYQPVVVEDGLLRAYPDLYRRNAIHSEAVYQALLSAGHDVSKVEHERVQRFVEDARQSRNTFSLTLEEVLGPQVAIAEKEEGRTP